jgi:hypothetical protein
LGESQKYDPSSVVEGVSSDDDNVDNVAQSQGDDVREPASDNENESRVDSVTGGADARLGTESVAASPGGAGETDLSPSSTIRRAAGAQRVIVQEAVAQAGAAKAALASAISKAPVVSSPSLSSSSSGQTGTGKSSNFDTVYAKCSEAKVAAMKEIQTQKSQCVLMQQAREHHFQSQKIMLEAKASQEDRKVRQKIEFEKNIATLFVQDETGNLARNYLQLLRANEQGDGAAADTSEIQMFAAQFSRNT